MARDWKKHSVRDLGTQRIFALKAERFESPRTGQQLDAIVLLPSDWVNVVALTEQAECVLIRQFRFGSERVELEIPGGMVDPGESPLMAAQRELREETGYVASRWSSLGSCAPNPAFLRNQLHVYLAEGAQRAGEPELEGSEDIEVELVPAARIDELIAQGEIDHALVIAAFHKLSLLRRGLKVR